MSFRNAEEFFHLALIAHAQHTSSQAEIIRFVHHVHGCHADITLCKALRITIVIQNCRHDIGMLLDQCDKCRYGISPRASGCAALYNECFAHFLFCLRLINDEEFPRLCITAARCQSARLDHLGQQLAGNRLVLIRTAALALIYHIHKTHTSSLLCWFFAFSIASASRNVNGVLLHGMQRHFAFSLKIWYDVARKEASG